jgi:hypothetical protein
VTDPVSPGPERRLEVLAVLVQRERVEGMFVIEPQMRVEKPILADLGCGTCYGESEGADRVPDSDELYLGRARILGQPLLLNGCVLGNGFADSDLIVGAS